MRSSGGRGRRIGASLVALVVGSLLLATAAAGQVGQTAEPSVSFGATTGAFGSRVELTVSQAPLLPNLVDAGGPTAQTALDSLGTANALAAYPWPGEVAVSLPGLVAGLGPQAPALIDNLPGLIGGLSPVPLPGPLVDLFDQIDLPADALAPLLEAAPPLPPYPFAAVANGFDRPNDSVDLGVGHLAASAANDAVMAHATMAPGAGGAAVVSVDARSGVTISENGEVAAEATGRMTGLQVGPIQIGSISSLARMAMDADGEVTTTSEFTASAIQLGALTVDLTADGLSIAGIPVPAPIADLLNQVLAGVGFELRVLEETVTDTGVVTSGLQITYPIDFRDLPQEFQGLGEGSVAVTIGQSAVTLTGAPVSPELDVADPGSSTDISGGGIPSEGSSGSSATGIADGSPPTPGPVVPAPSGSSDAAGQQPVAASRREFAEQFETIGIYMLVVGAALTTAGTGQLLRLLAFRPRPIIGAWKDWQTER